MGPVVSKQDIQTMMNTVQNRVLDRTASKQDMQMISDILKSLININQQNQQTLRQGEYQRSQLARRMMALEARLIQLEQEIHGYKDVLARVAALYSQRQQIVVTPAEVMPQTDGQAAQYVYRPI